MREAENIRDVEQLDIDWMGFIFYAPSLRYMPDDEACSEAVRRCARRKTGVFVNAGTDEITEKISRYGLDSVQLHGREMPETCLTLRQQDVTVIKAFSVAAASDVEQTEAYETCVDYFLFDTPSDAYGGSGRSFDWALLDAYAGATPFLLSGGICPASMGDLFRFAHPRWAGIDLNSGFETAPAQKNVAALSAFIRQVRNNENNESNHNPF
jgi:phosphoribosylanthranilate isomerase